MQPYDMKELEERVILVGVQESFSEDVEESLDELAELCERQPGHWWSEG